MKAFAVEQGDRKGRKDSDLRGLLSWGHTQVPWEHNEEKGRTDRGPVYKDGLPAGHTPWHSPPCTPPPRVWAGLCNQEKSGEEALTSEAGPLQTLKLLPWSPGMYALAETHCGAKILTRLKPQVARKPTLHKEMERCPSAAWHAVHLSQAEDRCMKKLSGVLSPPGPLDSSASVIWLQLPGRPRVRSNQLSSGDPQHAEQP